MDPLSILGAVSTVTKTTYWISSTLFGFIQSTRVIDKTLEELKSEVEGLTKALETIELSLEDPAFSRIKSGEDTKGPWGFLDVAVTDTQRTVNALERIVEGLGTVKKSANPFKRAVKQVKLNLDADEISQVKDRIHTHTTSLQLALQTASLLISCQSSEGIQTVERLIKAMHLNVELSRKNATDERLPTTFRNPDLVKHTEQLISSASTVLGSRSTAWGGSEMRFPHSSETGQPLDTGQRATIEDWIPHLASMEEELPETSDHGDPSATSDTLVGTDGFNIEEVRSTDSDSDDDYDIAKRCFEMADKDFSSDQHAKALEFLRAGLKRVEKLGLKKKARLELRTIHLRKGLSLLSLGKLSESEQCLLSLAWPQTTDDKSRILALHASSGLAQIHLCRRSFEKAEDWCNKSRIGWKRIAGKEHPAYITCLRLSAFSSELNGNHAEAAAMEEIANESKAAPAAVDTELEPYESLGFTIEKSRTLVTEYHKKIPDTTSKEASTKNRSLSSPKQPSSHAIDVLPSGSLHDAARKGDTDLIEKLLENGADIEEAEGKFNDTPLHLAARAGHESTVECLLNRGANIEAKEACGCTALIMAACQGQRSIVEFLLDRGANIEAKEEYGCTALIMATWQGQRSIIEFLLDHGANIEAKGEDGYTALSEAARAGHESIVKCLLDRGANIEDNGHYGHTALLRAACGPCGGQKSTVECLLDRGANIASKNFWGETAVLVACRLISKQKNMSETVRTIELLCSRGADVSVKDNVGNTPLKYAREVKDTAIRKELVSVLKRYGAKK